MCKIIDFDAFLGVVLEKQAEVQFRTLRKIIEHFEEESIVIDFSSGNVASALSHYPKIFAVSRENKCYSRANGFDLKVVKEEFDPLVPDDIKQQINDILNKKRTEYVGSKH